MLCEIFTPENWLGVFYCKNCLSLIELGMIRNIAIVCLKNEYAKQVASILAERLEMNWFDTFGMLLFEDAPRKLDETLKILGTREVRKHEEDVVCYGASFDNAIIVCESGAVESNKNWKNLKKNCVVVYLHCAPKRVLDFCAKQKFENAREKRFFCIDEKRVERRIEICKKKANVVVSATGKSPFVAASMVIRELAKWVPEN